MPPVSESQIYSGVVLESSFNAELLFVPLKCSNSTVFSSVALGIVGAVKVLVYLASIVILNSSI